MLINLATVIMIAVTYTFYCIYRFKRSSFL